MLPKKTRTQGANLIIDIITTNFIIDGFNRKRDIKSIINLRRAHATIHKNINSIQRVLM